MELSSLSISDLVALKIDAERTIDKYKLHYTEVTKGIDFDYLAHSIELGFFKYEETDSPEVYFKDSKDGIIIYINNIKRVIPALTEELFEMGMVNYVLESELLFEISLVLNEKKRELVFINGSGEDSKNGKSLQAQYYSRFWELKRTGKFKTDSDIHTKVAEEFGKYKTTISMGVHRETAKRKKIT